MAKDWLGLTILQEQVFFVDDDETVYPWACNDNAWPGYRLRALGGTFEVLAPCRWECGRFITIHTYNRNSDYWTRNGRLGPCLAHLGSHIKAYETARAEPKVVTAKALCWECKREAYARGGVLEHLAPATASQPSAAEMFADLLKVMVAAEVDHQLSSREE